MIIALLVFFHYNYRFHQEKIRTGKAETQTLRVIAPQSNSGPSSLPLAYPSHVYTAPQHTGNFPSANFPSNIDPHLPVLHTDCSGTNSLQDTNSSSQMHYLSFPPPVVNTDSNILQDYPKSEQPHETEILVPLNKVARITPFGGRKLSDLDTPASSVTTSQEASEEKMVFSNPGQDNALSQTPNTNVVQPQVLSGSSTSLYPASFHKLPPISSITTTSTAPEFTLNTQPIKSQPGKVGEGLPINTVPTGDIVLNQDMLVQGTGNINQFNLNFQA